MIAYVDASVLLRFVLGQPDKLEAWSTIQHGATSALAEVECMRTLDRLRVGGHLSDEQVADRRGHAYRLLEALSRIDLGPTVLARAAQPFPTTLGTLDAVHLASALLWRHRAGPDLVLATHDEQLARAARACGLAVVGV